jgi:hypothetical protein
LVYGENVICFYHSFFFFFCHSVGILYDAQKKGFLLNDKKGMTKKRKKVEKY